MKKCVKEGDVEVSFDGEHTYEIYINSHSSFIVIDQAKSLLKALRQILETEQKTQKLDDLLEHLSNQHHLKKKMQMAFEELVVFGRTEIYFKPINMTDPQNVHVIEPKATYQIPKYEITNEGLKDSDQVFIIDFCKGNKDDEAQFRQPGVFTESLIAAAKKYLEENNVGELATRETSMAITKLDEALLWIGKRASDRQRRGVQGTYQK